MERKVYGIQGVDCAGCAARIEAKFNDLPEVEEAVISFAAGQLRLTAEDPDGLLEKLTEIARTVEPGAVITPRGSSPAHHHHHEGCSCGHHHEHGACGHHHEPERSSDPESRDIRLLGLGAAAFLAGLLLEALGWTWPARGAFVLGYLVLGWQVLESAVKSLVRGHVLDENFLMAIATLGAFCIGEFPEALGVMLFYRVGAFFEKKAVERSRSQIMEAVDLRPEVVCLADGRVIPAGEAQVGDVLTLRPGDRIPLDAVVLSGESRVDTAPITGEPVPVAVQPGSAVVSGCLNTAGTLTVRVEKPLSESMVTRILNSVENAAASKPRMDRFITRFARIYTPIVVVLAASVAVVPSLVTGRWSYWIYTALSFLVMSCPCALVLSVPLAFFSGIGAGSRRGILFKGGASIEALSRVKGVVMDKTGTLTRGEFQVRQVEGGQRVLQLCASCEQASSHPIAASVVQAAREQGLTLLTPQKVEELPGRGIRAQVEGRTVLCGNAALLAENGVKWELPEMPAGTVVLVAVEGALAGYLVIADALKEGASEAVRALKARGCRVAMLTGDSLESAEKIAAQAGIQEVRAKLLPEEKLQALQELRARYGAVMYVGDGINDAPVLAGADVGAAMGSGADAAIEAADVVFMTSDVRAIPQTLALARRTQAIAWQNVVFALAVKALVMVLGLLGFASMWMAVFADSGVALLCVLNSIRLLYRKG